MLILLDAVQLMSVVSNVVQMSWHLLMQQRYSYVAMLYESMVHLIHLRSHAIFYVSGINAEAAYGLALKLNAC